MNESGAAQADSTVSPATTVPGSLLKRYLLALAGIICVALGWIGTFVPGLPTVGFLLIASYCFTRSCPWLEQRLIRNRWFARFLHYLDGDLEMPLKARIMALAMMWTSIAVSVTVLMVAGKRNPWLPGTIVVAGIVGTVAIWRFRRSRALVSCAIPGGPASKELPGQLTGHCSGEASSRSAGAERTCPAGFGPKAPVQPGK